MLIYSAGEGVVFKLRQNNIRREIKARIKRGVPENQLSKISFNYFEPVQWVKEGKEFKLGDRLYDVIKINYENDKIIYSCIDDIDEASLFKDLDTIVRRRLLDEDSNHTSSIQIIKTFEFYTFKYSIRNFNSVKDLLNNFSTKANFYSSVYLGIPSPPPWSIKA